MTNRESESSRISDAAIGAAPFPRWASLLLLLTIFAGTAIRFIGLDRKAFWHDEVYTTIMMRGEAPKEFASSTFNGPVTAGSVAAHLQSRPTAGFRAVVSDMSAHDTHHVPLFYGALGPWARRVGATFADLRLLSALAGVLALAAAAWAGAEMAGDRMAVLLATLVAVSPLHLAYAQEAREYALWTAAIFFQFGALVRALRSNARAPWAVYAAATVFAFYCQELTILVALAQAVMVGAFRLRAKGRFALALGVALVACLPWMAVMFVHRNVIVTATGWMTDGVPRIPTLLEAVRNWSWAFLWPPAWFPNGARISLSIGVTVLAMAVAILALRRADRSLAAVLAAGLVSVAVPFMIVDLASGGVRSRQVRYNFPGIVALEAAVAFFLAEASPRVRAAGLLAILLVGGATDVRYLRMDDWPTKLMSDRSLMKVVNAAPSPLVVSDDRDQDAAIRLAALATGLRSDAVLLRTRPGAMDAVPDWRHKDVFVPWPTPEMNAWALAQGAEQIPRMGAVYRLPRH